MNQLLWSILRESSPLMLLLYGTHGSELPGSLHVARTLASSFSSVNQHANVQLIGPISPWSCRRAYRFDRYLGDPNRFSDRDQEPDLIHLAPYRDLWQRHRPKTRAGLQDFFDEADAKELQIPSLFQAVQSVFPGLPGFTYPALQRRRLSYLLRSILSKLHARNFSAVFVIDVHTGVGPDAQTQIFHHRTSGQRKPYLVDSLAACLEEQTHMPVDALITETGVIDNAAGMVDALSELAFRTHGYFDQRNQQFQAMDVQWQERVDHHISLLFAAH